MKRPKDENSGPLPDCERCGYPENMHDGNGKVIGLDGGHICEQYVSEGYEE